MRDYLASRGVTVPERVNKGRTGNKNFMVKDPDGHDVEIVEYQPDSWTAKDAGRHLPADASLEQAMHVGILVGNLEASMKFYNGILGFEEFWRGSAANSKTLSWVNMRVPDGTDYFEFMLYDEMPAPDRRGSAHHLCLVVPDADKALAALDARPSRAELYASDRDPHRHQPQAPGQPVRSRRHARRADGAQHHRRQASAVLDAAAAAVTRLPVTSVCSSARRVTPRSAVQPG